MIKLYDYLESGNAYKVRLLLTHLGIPFERIALDILKGETRTPEYLRLNPNGRIPLLRWPDGRQLWESNAIIGYLAADTPFLPQDPFLRAQVMQWMCFEQYSHEPYIATVRFWTFSGTLDAHTPDEVNSKRDGGRAALAVMESHLQSQAYFVANTYSIADIALYAYTHVAEEGGYTLDAYPEIRAWLKRVQSQPGHIPITHA